MEGGSGYEISHRCIQDIAEKLNLKHDKFNRKQIQTVNHKTV